MRKWIFIAFVLLSNLGFAKGPDSLYVDSIRNIEYQLEGLSHNIINSRDLDERITSCYYFVQTLKKALQVPTSFDYEFTRLKTVSILKPEDETFRVFTWNLLLDSGKYMYFGAIQMNHPDTLVLYGLYDSSDKLKEPEFDIVDNKHWVGALYYQIHDYKFKGTKYYLMFGWDGEDHLINRKVIDILHFENGKPVFGHPVFEYNDDEYKSRLIFTFADRASIISRFDPNLNLIVYDHLAPMSPMLEGRYQYYLPDGTYDYLEYQKGFWLRKELLFKELDDNQHDLRKTTEEEAKEKTPKVKVKKGRKRKAFK